jgi:hypothetical protein
MTLLKIYNVKINVLKRRKSKYQKFFFNKSKFIFVVMHTKLHHINMYYLLIKNELVLVYRYIFFNYYLFSLA